MAKVKPIIFNTEMVRALLYGRKTQTRRVIKPQPPKSAEKIIVLGLQESLHGFESKTIIVASGDDWVVKSPYQPGDVLYVQEKWCVDDLTPDDIYYRANYTDKQAKELFNDIGLRWRQSIYMPRSVARLFLRVTKVRVERLQDISGENVAKRGYGYANNPWVWVIEFKVIKSESMQQD